MSAIRGVLALVAVFSLGACSDGKPDIRVLAPQASVNGDLVEIGITSWDSAEIDISEHRLRVRLTGAVPQDDPDDPCAAVYAVEAAQADGQLIIIVTAHKTLDSVRNRAEGEQCHDVGFEYTVESTLPTTLATDGLETAIDPAGYQTQPVDVVP